MISSAELRALLQNLESDRVERTVSVTNTDKFGEAICAFANDLPFNQLPGYLIVGAKDDGSCSGLNITDQLLQNLSAIRTDGNVVPPPSLVVQKFSFPDGELAVVEVQPHYQPPVKYKNRIWVRVGPTKRVANDADEIILNEKRSSFANTFDTLPCLESALDDISSDIFKLSYLPLAVSKEALEANHRDVKEQMASLKFYDLKADCPTNVGILMFGKNPEFFLSGAYVQYVRFMGLDVASDIEYEYKFSGDLFTQMKAMDDFIKSQVAKRVQKKLGEPYYYQFPPDSMKEFLFNAIIHRLYQSNSPIKFYEYEDRIEISNSGGLYGQARENFPNKNDYRNPALAEAAKTIGYVNRFSVGVRRAIQELKENGNKEPLFNKDNPNFFEVTIYRKVS
ncbi:MAG: ATP-binding protein [Chitinophagales bacterium]|nr:ATP-binding protein [Chitinophagales bacterium]